LMLEGSVPGPPKTWKAPIGLSLGSEKPPCTGIGGNVHGSCRRRSLGVSPAAAPEPIRVAPSAPNPSLRRERLVLIVSPPFRIVAIAALPGRVQPTFPATGA